MLQKGSGWRMRPVTIALYFGIYCHTSELGVDGVEHSSRLEPSCLLPPVEMQSHVYTWL